MRQQLLSQLSKSKGILTLASEYTTKNETYVQRDCYVRSHSGQHIIAYSEFGTNAGKCFYFSYHVLDKNAKPISDLCTYHVDVLAGVEMGQISIKAFHWRMPKDQPRWLQEKEAICRDMSPDARAILESEFGEIKNGSEYEFGLHGFCKNTLKNKTSSMRAGMDPVLLYLGKAEFLSVQYPEHRAAFQKLGYF